MAIETRQRKACPICGGPLIPDVQPRGNIFWDCPECKCSPAYSDPPNWEETVKKMMEEDERNRLKKLKKRKKELKKIWASRI
jgi:uncharacterized Zn finger protein (UPF0148 family)